MSKLNRPLSVEPAESGVIEAAYRKVAARVSAREPAHPDSTAIPPGYVFPGTMPRPSVTVPEGTPTANRRPSRRKYSPFNLVLGLLIGAIVSVLYISNVIAVSRLAAEVGVLEERHRSIINEQEMLRAEIARLSGLERVRSIAEERLGMSYPDAVPGWLSIDPERVSEFESIARSARSGGR